MADSPKDFMSIKSWSEGDQPRYKLKHKGAENLSDSELLAILIGTGSRSETALDLCKRLLKSVDGDLDKLAVISLKELMTLKGIGEAKAITISAAMELGRRRQMQTSRDKTKITDSRSAYEVLAPLLADKLHEEFWVLHLNRSNVLIQTVRISSGGVTATVVDPKIIFKGAIQQLASGLVLCHNHPSGQLEASHQDLTLTRKIKEIGQLLEISVLDHLIIGQHGYLSMADEGLM